MAISVDSLSSEPEMSHEQFTDLALQYGWSPLKHWDGSYTLTRNGLKMEILSRHLKHWGVAMFVSVLKRGYIEEERQSNAG